MKRSFQAMCRWQGLLVIILMSMAWRGFVNQDMFFDGVFYSAIARNLSEGFGSFWEPAVDLTRQGFREHPPLGFWTQSLAFMIFGDSRLVDHGYSYLMLLLQTLLIGLLVRLTPSNRASWSLSVVCQLCFLAFPITAWSVRSGQLENTLVVFTLASVVLFLCGFQNKRARMIQYLLLLCSGLACVAAFFVKGPLGLYPLFLPFCFALAFFRKDSWSRVLSKSLIFFFGAALGFIAVLVDPAARGYLEAYLDQQLFASLSGAREISLPYARILIRLIAELCVPFSLGALVIGYFFVRQYKKSDRLSALASSFMGSLKQPDFVFFLAIALSASLPLVVSPKNRPWFLTLSLPFFAISLGLFFHKIFASLKLPSFNEKRVLVTLFSVAILAITFQSLTPKRHKYQDLKTDFASLRLGGRSDKEQRVAVACPPDLLSQWTLRAHLARDFRLGLKALTLPIKDEIMLISLPKNERCRMGDEWMQINDGAKKFAVLKR